MQNLIKNMQALNTRTQSSALLIAFQHNLPISSVQYPIYNFYPKFSVDHHKKMREQIFQQEKKIGARKDQIAQIHSLTEELMIQELRFREKQEALQKAEKNRREAMEYEDDMRLQQKIKMETESRERRLNQLKNLEI